MIPPVSSMDMATTGPSETPDFITKRPHKKSRAGCHGCKRRKIKCDESRPTCTSCQKRKEKCVYPRVAGSPASTSEDSLSDQSVVRKCNTPPAHSLCEFANALNLANKPTHALSITSISLSDLRFMYHFTTVTSKTLFGPQSRATDIAQIHIPQLALQHDFMMQCILGIASFHLHKLQPERPELLTRAVVHRVNALNGLRKAISHPSKENFQAILAASLSILVLASDRCSADSGQLWIISWFGLWAGMREMIRLISWDYIVHSGLSPLFPRDVHPHTALGNLPTALVNLVATMDNGDENMATINDAVFCLGKLYECILFPSAGSRLSTIIVAWPANIEIFAFVSLLRQMHPQALVIAAYYLVFTKLIDSAWWMDGTSDPEIEAIASTIPVKFQSFMLIPMQAVHLRNRKDIVDLLLSQLPVTKRLDAAANLNIGEDRK